VEGFTADHWAAFKQHAIERVLIAYDHDEAGDLFADTSSSAAWEANAARASPRKNQRYPDGSAPRAEAITFTFIAPGLTFFASPRTR